jgi:uncharacterized membrane-anchored protein
MFTAKQMLSKVPEVTLFFWLIKVLCTTVGETFADDLTANLGFGSNTLYFVGALTAVGLTAQFLTRRYVAPIYWLAVVLISVFGTLITDKLTDDYGVQLTITTTVFTVGLLLVFAVWYASEKTLSIHSITTTRREAFYWLAILVTFALGTAAGDLIAEEFKLGYFNSIILFSGIIAIITIAHFELGLNAVVAFWAAYVVTRPLGASIGDWLSQDTIDGGLGLGPNTTSVIFLGAILGLVTYLTITKKDEPRPSAPAEEWHPTSSRGIGRRDLATAEAGEGD